MVNIGAPHETTPSFYFAVPPHVLILEARFYNDINDMLIDGVTEVLKKVGASFEIVTVPGALEIPVALQLLATRQQGRKFDAFIVLGCVIRGETTHYEIVSNESARGIMDISIYHNLAIGNGILTVENTEQAVDRADKSRQNKGGGAAMAALAMLALKHACEGK